MVGGRHGLVHDAPEVSFGPLLPSLHSCCYSDEKRVGGNFQDLTTRSAIAGLGAVWGGLAFAAGNGNPWVMAAFAAIYMLPMMYRFTQSSHPVR